MSGGKREGTEEEKKVVPFSYGKGTRSKENRGNTGEERRKGKEWEWKVGGQKKEGRRETHGTDGFKVFEVKRDSHDFFINSEGKVNIQNDTIINGQSQNHPDQFKLLQFIRRK